MHRTARTLEACSSTLHPAETGSRRRQGMLSSRPARWQSSKGHARCDHHLEVDCCRLEQEALPKAATCAAAPGTRATTDWPRMLPTGGRHPERMATLDATTRSAGEPGRRTALRDRKSPRCGDGNKSETKSASTRLILNFWDVGVWSSSGLNFRGGLDPDLFPLSRSGLIFKSGSRPGGRTK
jgi:hypothetical protein